MTTAAWRLADRPVEPLPEPRWRLAPELPRAVSAMDRLLRLALDWQLHGSVPAHAADAPLDALKRLLFVTAGERARLLVRLQERLPLNRGYLSQTRPDLMDMAATMLMRHRPSGRIKAPLSAYRLALGLAAAAPEFQADLCSLFDRTLRRHVLVPVRSCDAVFSLPALAWALHGYLSQVDARAVLALHREVQVPMLQEPGWGGGFDLMLLAVVEQRRAPVVLPAAVVARLAELPELHAHAAFADLRQRLFGALAPAGSGRPPAMQAASPAGAPPPFDLDGATPLPVWLAPLLSAPDALARLFPAPFASVSAPAARRKPHGHG